MIPWLKQLSQTKRHFAIFRIGHHAVGKQLQAEDNTNFITPKSFSGYNLTRKAQSEIFESQWSKRNETVKEL